MRVVDALHVAVVYLVKGQDLVVVLVICFNKAVDELCTVFICFLIHREVIVEEKLVQFFW